MNKKISVFVLIVFVMSLGGISAQEKPGTVVFKFANQAAKEGNTLSTLASESPLLTYDTYDEIIYNVKIGAYATAETHDGACPSVLDEAWTDQLWPLGTTGASTAWVSPQVNAVNHCSSLSSPINTADSESSGSAVVTALATSNSLAVSGSLLGFIQTSGSDPHECPGPLAHTFSFSEATATLELRNHNGNWLYMITIPFFVEQACHMEGTAYVYILTSSAVHISRQKTPPISSTNPSVSITPQDQGVLTHNAQINWGVSGCYPAGGSLNLNKPGELNFEWDCEIDPGPYTLRVGFILSHSASIHAGPCSPNPSIAYVVNDGFAVNIAFTETNPAAN